MRITALGVGVGLDDARARRRRRAARSRRARPRRACRSPRRRGRRRRRTRASPGCGRSSTATRSRSTPGTRPTAPSITAVISRSIASGAAPVEGGGDGDDRPVDVGQLAHLDAAERGEPGEHHQRVEHEGEDRPAHEERDAPAAAVGAARPVRLAHARVRRGPRPRPPARIALEADRDARAQALQALGDHPLAGGELARDQHRVAVALHDAHRHALGRARRGRPRRRRPRRPTGSPADRRRGTPRRGTRARSRRPCRRAAGRRGCRARPARAACGWRCRPGCRARRSRRSSGSSGRASAVAFDRVADGEPAGEALRHAEVDEDPRAVVDGGELGRRRRPGCRARPAGCRRCRRSARRRCAARAPSAASRRSSSRGRGRRGGPRAAPRRSSTPLAASCSNALERRLGLGDGELGPGERDRLGLVVEPRDHVARLHPRARGDLERRAAARRPAASPRPSGSRGRRRSPRPAPRPPTAPPRRRCTVTAVLRRASPDRCRPADAGAAPSAAGRPRRARSGAGLRQERRPRRDRRRHQRERREDLLPPGQSAPQLIRCPILSSERGRGVSFRRTRSPHGPSRFRNPGGADGRGGALRSPGSRRGPGRRSRVSLGGGLHDREAVRVERQRAVAGVLGPLRQRHRAGAGQRGRGGSRARG